MRDVDVGWDELDLPRYTLYSGAGIFAFELALYPLDLLRTREQFLTTMRPPTLVAATRDVLRQSGVWGLWRGFPIHLAGAMPSQLVYFGAYEWSKAKFRESAGPDFELAADMASGFVADTVSHCFSVPFDVVSQRMQVASLRTGHPAGNGGVAGTTGVQLFRHVMRSEGYRGLYRGYAASLVSSGIHSAIWFGAYEKCKRGLRDRHLFENDGLKVSLVSGTVAGVFGVVLTNPLEIVRTRYQTFDPSIASEARHLRQGLVAMFFNLAREEGLTGLARGLVPRLLSVVPTSAVAFTCYEFTKHLSLIDKSAVTDS